MRIKRITVLAENQIKEQELIKCGRAFKYTALMCTETDSNL